MKFRTNAVLVNNDTLCFTWEIVRPDPIPTRTKFRRRRLLRLVRAAAFAAARGQINKPLSVESHSSLTQHVIQVCRDTAKRYAHLRA
jgi:cytochrome c oxidase assembly factor CtaG